MAYKLLNPSKENAAALEQPFYLHQHINDFDEFCASARHWDLNYRQIEAGQFCSELLIFGDTNTLFTRAKLNRGLIQQGTPPQGLITLGLLANPKINIHWRNIDICGDMLFIFPPGAELHSITQADFDVFAISLSEKKLDQICAELELPEFNTLVNKNEVFRCHSAKLFALRQFLFAVEKHIITAPVAHRDCSLLLHIEQEIAESVVKLLAESYQPVLRKTLRKRDKALNVAESYLFECSREVINISELCMAANVSERTLQYAFQERYGLTPKAYTLISRLNAVHKQLRRADPDSQQVANIAQQHGFWHMGQFSADYKKLFARLPSETLKRVL